MGVLGVHGGGGGRVSTVMGSVAHGIRVTSQTLRGSHLASQVYKSVILSFYKIAYVWLLGYMAYVVKWFSG